MASVVRENSGCWRYWPELYAGRTLEQDVKIEPSDPTQFYGIAEYVDDALGDELRGKWTPVQVADRFRTLAAETIAALKDANDAINEKNAELHSTELDFRILADMANYHADRLTAAMHFAFYQRTKHFGRLAAALEYMKKARKHWQTLSNLTDGIYNDNLVFGSFDRGHEGHWKDRLNDIDTDIDRLEKMLDIISSDQQTIDYEVLPGETVPVDLPIVKCEPVKSAQVGQDLTLELIIESQRAIQSVRCYYKKTNQTLPFQCQEMTNSSPDLYQVTIPGSRIESSWDLMVFFEIILESKDGFRWPDWRFGAPYFVIEILNQST